MSHLEAEFELLDTIQGSMLVLSSGEGALAAVGLQGKIAPEAVVLEVSVAGPIVGRLEVVSTW